MGKNSLLMFLALTFNETDVRTQKLSGVSTECSMQGKFSQCGLSSHSARLHTQTQGSIALITRVYTKGPCSVPRNMLTHSFLKV